MKTESEVEKNGYGAVTENLGRCTCCSPLWHGWDQGSNSVRAEIHMSRFSSYTPLTSSSYSSIGALAMSGSNYDIFAGRKVVYSKLILELRSELHTSNSELSGLYTRYVQPKAPSTPVTMSKQHCRMLHVERFFRQSRKLLRHCCSFWQQCRTKFRPFDKVETNLFRLCWKDEISSKLVWHCWLLNVHSTKSNVASTLLLVWTGLNGDTRHKEHRSLRNRDSWSHQITVSVVRFLLNNLGRILYNEIKSSFYWSFWFDWATDG